MPIAFSRIGVGPYKYLVLKKSEGTKVLNEMGQIVYPLTSDDEAAENWALSNLDATRVHAQKVVAIGDFNEDAVLKIDEKTHFLTIGSHTLGDNKNCNQLELMHPAANEQQVIIEGGLWKGNKGNQTSGHGFYLRAATNPSYSNYHGHSIKIKDVRLRDQKQDSIRVDFSGAASNTVSMEDVFARDAEGYGVYLDDSCDGVLKHCGIDAYSRGLYIVGGGPNQLERMYFPAGAQFVQTVDVIMNNFWCDQSTFVGFLLQGVRFSHFCNGILHVFGSNASTNNGLTMSASGGINCTDNEFANITGGRTGGSGTNRMDYAIEEGDANQDYNTYVNINGRDCISGTLRLRGANSKNTNIQGSVV